MIVESGLAAVVYCVSIESANGATAVPVVVVVNEYVPNTVTVVAVTIDTFEVWATADEFMVPAIP